MSQLEDVDKYEMEWKISPSWTEIINNAYDEKDEESNEDTPPKKSKIYQNYNILQIKQINLDLIKNSILDELLSLEPKISPKNEDIDYNSLKLIEFKKMQVNKLKEDIIYYCSSPQKLLNYKKIESSEKEFEF